MFDTKRTILVGWFEIAQKYKRAKNMLTKHMANTQQKSFLAWKEYVTKNLKVKRLMMGHMAKLEQRTFRAWADYVGKGKLVREKIGKHLVGAKRERFQRWAKFTETSLKIKVRRFFLADKVEIPESYLRFFRPPFVRRDSLGSTLWECSGPPFLRGSVGRRSP